MTMSVRSVIVTAALFLAAPVFAQTANQQAAQNADQWAIFQQFYPARAIAAHEEGAVGFKVTLDSQGVVTACQVTHSSGHALLDQETCNVITLHAQFKPDPGLSPSQVRTSEGVIAWKLPASFTALPQPQPTSTGAPPEKVICRKTLRTGSLAAYDRTCLTAREWSRQSDAVKEPWDEMQGRKGSTHGN
jgi:TonB family protein